MTLKFDSGWAVPGLLFAVVLVSGCGSSENDLASVTGTVTLDEEPLPDAFVVFAPTSGGTTAYGRTDSNGRYEMMFTDDEMGAWLGMNRVEISTGDVGATGGAGRREMVPVTYNRNSTLQVDVQPGTNEFDFHLETDAGQIIQLPED